MAYTKQTWQTGDTVTAEKLNHMENGIGSGGVLVVNMVYERLKVELDKTWKEIRDAAFAVVYGDNGEGEIDTFIVVYTYHEDSSDGYYVRIVDLQNGDQYTYVSDTADGVLVET